MLRSSILRATGAIQPRMVTRMAASSPAVSIIRNYSTPAPVKPNIKLLAEIRKTIEGISMMKAKEALIQTNNDLEKALEWVRDDEAKAGVKKAEKLKGRQALEGLVGVVVGEVGEHGNRGAIVE
ncbi:Elongation factor Ts, mitochondrial, partial [Podila verticillata]